MFPKGRLMMNKFDKKAKIISALIAVFFVAIGVIGSILYMLYNTTLKPMDFSAVSGPATGEGTGYYRHCYEELTPQEQKVYSVILQKIYAMPEKIEIPEMGSSDLNKIFTAISYDNPDLFFLGLNCRVYTEGLKTFFEPSYTMTLADYQKQLDELKTIIPVVIQGAQKYSSLYEKELYVHDYIISNCVYIAPEGSPNANSMYGCLVEGKASCEGYSRAFQYLMNVLNIDNRLVTGESAEDGVNYVGHMWNYVVLDGEGYFVDVTWDDPKTATQVLRHTFFNVSTNDILVEHRNIEQTIPLTTATKYNYFIKENAFVYDVSEDRLANSVENAVYKARQRNYSCVELRFKDATALYQAKDTLFNAGVVYTVFHDVRIIEDLIGAKVYYSTDEEMNAICLFF